MMLAAPDRNLKDTPSHSECGMFDIFGEDRPKRKYIPKDTKLKVIERQKNKCAICGKSLKIGSYHIDHKRAVALGGSDSIRNLQALCPSCHDRKNKEDARKIARKKKKEREESWW